MTVPYDTDVLPYNEAFTDEGQNEDEEYGISFPPTPVLITNDVQRQMAPHFGSWTSWAIPVFGIQIPVQILQRRITRYRSLIRNPAGGQSVQLASSPQGLSIGTPGAAFTLAAGETVEMFNQEPVYAIVPIGSTPATLYVLDEAYDAAGSAGVKDE